MAHSSLFGTRCLRPTVTADTIPPTVPAGRRTPSPGLAVSAHRGGRHHMAGPPPSLSQLIPKRPAPLGGVSADAGGRHHYGKIAQNQMSSHGRAMSEDELSDLVATEMFGSGIPTEETEDGLYAEADALIYAIENDLD